MRPVHAVTVDGMRTSNALAEPLADAAGLILTHPARELYAWLWRTGLLESRGAQRTSSSLRGAVSAGTSATDSGAGGV